MEAVACNISDSKTRTQIKHSSHVDHHLLLYVRDKSVQTSLSLFWFQSGLAAQVLHYDVVVHHLISQPCQINCQKLNSLLFIMYDN